MDSLTIATANLLRSFGIEPDMEDLADRIDDSYEWSALPLYNVHFSITEIGEYGTYPYSGHSIIKFDNGCYYYVDSPEDRTVRDLDGQTQSMQQYGTPVAWATYEYSPTQPKAAPPVEPMKTFTEATDSRGIHYKALQVHRRMYVNKNPANKYKFDEIVTHMDAPRKVVEQVPYGTPVYVVMEADHPIPPNHALYYMDAEAVGDFRHTEVVSEAVGFHASDLSDGSPPPTQSITETVKTYPTGTLVKPTLVNNVIDATVGKLAPRPSTATAKASIDVTHAGIYELLGDIKVKELDGRHDPIEAARGTRMHITGFFKYDGQTYGKPDPIPKLRKFGYTFKVPTNALTLIEKEADYQARLAARRAKEDELINEPVTITDKAPRSYTFQEKLLAAFGTIVASYHNHQTKKVKKLEEQ